MFADDMLLCAEVAAKYGPLPQPIVDVGGLSRPTIADYQVTIDAMAKLRHQASLNQIDPGEIHPSYVEQAQRARYLEKEMPLSFLGPYSIENPQEGGLPIELLHEKYPGTIGTAILLSVLEHVKDPIDAIDRLREAMVKGGLAIVSAPWQFPTHYGPEDNWRFSPSGLRHVFDSQFWQVLESGQRLNIGAEEGVLDISTGRAQIIQSSYLVARAV